MVSALSPARENSAMRRSIWVLLTLWAVLVVAGFPLDAAANAEKRVALVVGNGSYQNVAKLANPPRDAAAVAALFKAAGFQVVDVHLDVGISELRRAVSGFAETVSNADLAIVYFAGHGIEVDGTNYLIPIDAKLTRDFNV